MQSPASGGPERPSSRLPRATSKVAAIKQIESYMFHLVSCQPSAFSYQPFLRWFVTNHWPLATDNYLAGSQRQLLPKGVGTSSFLIPLTTVPEGFESFG